MRNGKPVVYYTHWCPPAGPDSLRPYCEVIEAPDDRTPSTGEVREMGYDAEAIGYFAADLIDDRIIAACPILRILAGFGKGFDNVDVEAATRRGIWVTNIPTDLTEPTADMAWALLLAVARRVVEGDTFVRSGGFPGWDPRRLLGATVYGKTLGVLGFGLLGRAIARRARGFEMRVLYHDRRRADAQTEAALQSAYAEREAVIRQSDFLVMAVPLTGETYHWIGPRELQDMKPSAYLINPARGSEVDEAAVASALKVGTLAGYAADVFEVEDQQYPNRPREVHPALSGSPSATVLTPHLSTASLEIRTRLARFQAGCILNALEGRRPAGAVNDVPGHPPLIHRAPAPSRPPSASSDG